MQIKTTMRYHLMPVHQNSCLQEANKQVLERMCRKGDSHSLLVGMQTGAATVQRSTKFPQKFKNGTPYDPEIPLLGIYPKKPETLICFIFKV